jgi:hypothetical protein
VQSSALTSATPFANHLRKVDRLLVFLVPQRRCTLGDQLLSLLREQLGYIILGTVFLFFGLTACAIAAIRQRTDVRVLTWWGIWSGIYGARLLAQTPAVIAVLPRSLQIGAPYVSNAITYLLVVAALLAWSELTVGKMRLLIQIMVFPASAIFISVFSLCLIFPDWSCSRRSYSCRCRRS